MKYSVSNPGLLTIQDGDESHFGGIQDWYLEPWRSNPGCGPTCAANLFAYLAMSKPDLRALYSPEGMSRGEFTRHMYEVFDHVTPGNMGMNKIEMFTGGAERFAKNRGLELVPRVFDVPGFAACSRPEVSELHDFVRGAFGEADCPIGFVNLTRGREKRLQGWHWITITEAEILEDGSVICTASDEGLPRVFDLKLWYQTTRLHGWLAYFVTP